MGVENSLNGWDLATERVLAMSKQLTRSRDKRMIGGVCGGLAEYTNVDPSIIRLVWALLVLLEGAGLLLYIIAWIVIPERKT